MNEKLETINSEIFDSFNPDEEIWVIGGASSGESINVSHGPMGNDFTGDITFDQGGPKKIAE